MDGRRPGFIRPASALPATCTVFPWQRIRFAHHPSRVCYEVRELEIRQVSDTAFMAAAYRALESTRADALFRDPLADKLAGEQGRRILETMPKIAMTAGWTVVIRTRIIDSMIEAAIGEGIDTIVNLGAGLDTRPYRMDLPPELRWIEVDYPHVFDLKEDRLAGERVRCRLERIRVDLADEMARRDLLADVGARSNRILVLTEAVTPYLTEDAVAALGTDLRSLDSIRYWIVDYFSPASYRYRQRSGMARAMRNAPFLFEPRDYLEFFAGLGWAPKEIRYFAMEGRRLNRQPPFPPLISALTWVAGMLASAQRRREMMEYAGVVLFEPTAASAIQGN